MVSTMINNSLPVYGVLDELKQALHLNDQVMLQAPPGAGKTTVVPLALMDQDWLGHSKILVLEPRRIATRAAALRMAETLGEKVGETIGYSMRLESRVSKQTKVHVITEGILTKMLMDDPELSGVGLVIFDEFHERSLDADLALSLCLKSREIFRAEPLKLLVMSATMDSDRIAGIIGAPVVASEGKQYPVDLVYGQPAKRFEKIVDRTVATIKRAVEENPESSVLVFLPGEGEIRRVLERLSEDLMIRSTGVEVLPLFGNLSQQAQQYAIAPGHRKIVLATNIAETSLTIEGVDVVVDSGLVRVPAFDPASAMTRLSTLRISRASSIQRAGRAGRLRPGKCYRLWSASQQQELALHSNPEITNADLLPVALQLLRWGIDSPEELTWIDPPAEGPFQQARDTLAALGAITSVDKSVRLTAHGERMSELAVHPRLAHMLLMGCNRKLKRTATLLAAVLSDRDPFDDPDMMLRLTVLNDEIACPRGREGWKLRTQKLAKQFEAQLERQAVIDSESLSLTPVEAVAYLLACAFPDRIARKRHSAGYQLANGRSASLAKGSLAGKDQWLAVAEVSGLSKSNGDIIRSAAPLKQSLFDGPLSSVVVKQEIVEWDKKANRFVAETRNTIGELILSRTRLEPVPVAAKRKALINHLHDTGLNDLHWTKELRQWQARVQLAGTSDKSLPDLSDAHLLETLDIWLAPFLDTVTRPTDFKKLDLVQILHSRLSFDQHKLLAKSVPERISVPSGSRVRLDYTQYPPVLAVKLQELFGMSQTPSVLRGELPVVIHLLSPGGHPLQVTQDLPHFWRNTYQDVRKDMRGRYPRHPWPEDPLTATATGKTKRALAKVTQGK